MDPLYENGEFEMFMKRLLLVTLGLATLVTFALAQTAQARTNREPLNAQLVSLSSLNLGGDCCTPQPVCCPKPCVIYRHHGPKLCCGCCQPPVQTVLKVKNPCTGCETDVTVCVPACCTGEPKECCGSGIFGRELVTYEWCCGYKVKVAFKHSGDLIVSTWGR